ncbi:MAG: hypothetical protein LBC51_06205 [Treponema sp.]|jgi:hypothetical protein|nr:hypothetical protein [Treponema sp.]
MTGWDVLDTCISVFPPIVAVLVLIAAAILFLVGFSRRALLCPLLSKA